MVEDYFDLADRIHRERGREARKKIALQTKLRKKRRKLVKKLKKINKQLKKIRVSRPNWDGED